MEMTKLSWLVKSFILIIEKHVFKMFNQIEYKYYALLYIILFLCFLFLS